MKKTLIFNNFAYFLGILLVAAPQTAVAGLFSPKPVNPPTFISTLYQEKGEEFYDQGDHPQAIREFSKALMADSGNTKAKLYLNKMGVEGNVYKGPHEPLIQISKLAQENKVYRYQLADLKERYDTQKTANSRYRVENQAYCEKLADTEEKLNLANIKLDVTYDQYVKSTQVAREMVAGLKASNKDKQRQVNLFNRSFKKHLNLLDIQHDQASEAIFERNKRINDLHGEVRYVKELAQKRTEADELKMAEQTDEFNQRLAAQRAETRETKKYYAGRHHGNVTKIENLTNRLDEKVKDLENIADDLLLKDLDLAKQEKIIIEQEAEISETERLAYAPYIRDEDAFQRGYAQAAQKERQKAQQKSDRQEDKVVRLEKELKNTKEQIRNLEEKAAQYYKDEIRRLRAAIEAREAKLKDRDSQLQEKQGSLELMNARLTDAQERLQIVQDIIEEKDQRIRILESEIRTMRDQILKQTN